MNHKFKMENSKKEKAISPSSVALLFIVIAVVLIVMTYAWIPMHMDNTTTQGNISPYKAKVDFKDQNTITIDIGNGGTANSQIIQVYVGTSSSTIQNQQTNPISPIALNAGSTASFDVSYSWTAGKVYYFKVVTASGIPLEFTEQAPQ